MEPSWKRRFLTLLGFYIDFILCNVITGLLQFGLTKLVPVVFAAGFANWFGEWAVAAILVAVGRYLGISVGEKVIAAARHAKQHSHIRVWPNLALGTFTLLDGLKQVVRWTQLDFVMPVFGMLDTTPAKAAVLMASGSLFIVAGISLLFFDRRGPLLALAALASSVLAIVASLPVLAEGIERTARARSVVKGVLPDPEMIKSMQNVYLPIFAVIAAVMLVLIYLAWKSRRAVAANIGASG